MIGPNLSFSKKIVVNAYCFYVLVILLPITVFPFRTRKTVPSRSFLRDTYKNIDNKLFLLTPHSKNAIQMFSFAEGQAGTAAAAATKTKTRTNNNFALK